MTLGGWREGTAAGRKDRNRYLFLARAQRSAEVRGFRRKGGVVGRRKPRTVARPPGPLPARPNERTNERTNGEKRHRDAQTRR